ncbi:MAG: DUF433 domain-containing protein [Prosthecobacter sp.]|uniref:DUF433 domain-containing protein n=1 Tax=Prosthecobacter sp. TaxID=1965333 RepID=UPI0038FFF17D
MNTLETDIEISANGSVRLLSPLPAWLRPGRSHVLLVMADSGSASRAGYVQEAAQGIEKTENICGGDACIASTRIPVWTLEQSRRLGSTEAELLDAYPSLKRHDLAAAWAYVAGNKPEVENAIRENEEA